LGIRRGLMAAERMRCEPMFQFNNPAVLVPLGAFVVAIVAIVSGQVGVAHNRRIKAEQRLAMMARGVPPGEIEAMLNASREGDERLPSTPTRRLANSRRSAMVLMSVGVGIVLLGVALTVILEERDVLSIAAAGLVPLAIGVGFLADYSLQRREIERFGMGLDEDGRGL